MSDSIRAESARHPDHYANNQSPANEPTRTDQWKPVGEVVRTVAGKATGRKPYAVLAGIPFATKQSLVAHIQNLLNNVHCLGQRVTDPAHDALLREIAMMHPCAAQKFVKPIAYFRVMRHGDRGIPLYANARAFYAIFDDGQIEPFSYRKCLGLTGRDHASAVNSAARKAVGNSIAAFKAAALTMPCRCSISEVELNKANSHVDHAGEWPFARIRDAWLAETAADLAVVADQGGIGWRFASPDTIAEFQRFHDSRAELTLVSAEANMRAGARGYRRHGPVRHGG